MNTDISSDHSAGVGGMVADATEKADVSKYYANKQYCPYCFHDGSGPMVCCEAYYQNAGSAGFKFLSEEEAKEKRKSALAQPADADAEGGK